MTPQHEDEAKEQHRGRAPARRHGNAAAWAILAVLLAVIAGLNIVALTASTPL